MKFSYQWLRELSGTERTPEALADLLMMHAFEVEELEHVGFESEAVVVGEVVGLEPHPNADKLRVAQVNVGEEVLTIVCGALGYETGFSGTLFKADITEINVNNTVSPNAAKPAVANALVPKVAPLPPKRVSGTGETAKATVGRRTA